MEPTPDPDQPSARIIIETPLEAPVIARPEPDSVEVGWTTETDPADPW